MREDNGDGREKTNDDGREETNDDGREETATAPACIDIDTAVSQLERPLLFIWNGEHGS